VTQINNCRFKILTVAIALALGAAACGGGDDSPAGSPSVPTEAAAPTQAPAPTEAPAAETAPESAAPAPASDLPSVEMVDVATGTTVNLASFAPAEQPLVLWFWAPH